MRSFPRLLAAVAVVWPILAFADPVPKTNPADDDWRKATTLAAPTPSTTTTPTTKTTAQLQADEKQRSDQFAAAAQSARNFYTTYPTDPRVPAAKKLEVTNLIQGLTASAADHGHALTTAAGKVRVAGTHCLPDAGQKTGLARVLRFRRVPHV